MHDPTPQHAGASVGGRPRLVDMAAVGLITLVHAIFVHWPVLTDPYRYHNNWRQSPHWVNPARTAFHPDDIFLKYAEFNTAPFENMLYKFLAGFGPDILWGKIVGIAFFIFGAVVVYITGHAMRGRFGGFVAATMFVFLPSAFRWFAGGFSSGMSLPLLCLAVLFVYRRAWWAFVPLMLAQVFVYPMVAVHTGFFLIVDALLHDLPRLRDPALWRRKYLPLAIAAVLCAVALLGKYATPHDYGHLTDRTEILDRVEFGMEGRARLIPISSMGYQLRKFWLDPFHVALAAIAFLGLGRRMLRLPRGLVSLLVASAALYWIADLLLIRLYFPNRYVMRTLPLIAVLAGACWMTDLRRRYTAPLASWHPRLRVLGRTPIWAAAAILLAVIGVATFHERLIPPGGSGVRGDRFSRTTLYAAISRLPGRPMIAAPPRLASELPLMTGRSVVVSKEFTHPWWTDLWTEVSTRNHDVLRAYFTNDPADVLEVTDKYDVDFWLVDRTDFRSDGRRRKVRYMEPFTSWVNEGFPTNQRSVLIRLDNIAYWSGKRYFLIARPDLERYLQGPRGRRAR